MSEVYIKQKYRGKKLYSFFIITVLSLFYTGFYWDSFPNHQTELLVIIDFNDFMCFSCLDSFIEFCHSLPLHSKDGKVCGVLVFDDADETDISFKIVEKKLRGFISANSIKFPVLIDYLHIFNPLAEEGTAIILFNHQENCIKKYLFPLNNKQKVDVLRALKD